MANGRLSRDGEDRNGEVTQLLAATDAVAAVVADVRLPALMTRPVVLLAGRRIDAAIADVILCGERELVTRALRTGRHLTHQQVEMVLRALLDALPPASAPADSVPADDAVQRGLVSPEEIEEVALEGALRKPSTAG